MSFSTPSWTSPHALLAFCRPVHSRPARHRRALRSVSPRPASQPDFNLCCHLLPCTIVSTIPDSPLKIDRPLVPILPPYTTNVRETSTADNPTGGNPTRLVCQLGSSAQRGFLEFHDETLIIYNFSSRKFTTQNDIYK